MKKELNLFVFKEKLSSVQLQEMINCGDFLMCSPDLAALPSLNSSGSWG